MSEHMTAMLVDDLKVVYRPLTELKPYDKNPRKHSKEQIRAIARSIEIFGFVNPLILDKDDAIVAGHGRYMAAKHLKLATVPTIRVEEMTPQMAAAYRIADNRLAEQSGWDLELVALEFETLDSQIPVLDLTITGFGIAEVDKMLRRDEEEEDADIQEELETASSAVPVSKSGDLWLLDEHKLLCGDALKPEDYAKLMDHEKAQAVISDPPFNVRIAGHVLTNKGKGKKAKHDEFAMASGEMDSGQFTDFLQAAFHNMADHSTDGSLHYVFMDWRHIREIMAAGTAVYADFKNLIVWNKDNGGMGSLYRSKHELIFLFKNGTAPHVNNIELGKKGRYRTNVWDCPGQNTFHGKRDEELAMHPTVKPVRLIADAILDSTAPKDIILDPFGGSGTTLLAAEKTGRRARLIEYDVLYVDLAVRRWQDKTGRRAVHADTGRTFNDIAAEIHKE